jgi:hypothetical protein
VKRFLLFVWLLIFVAVLWVGSRGREVQAQSNISQPLPVQLSSVGLNPCANPSATLNGVLVSTSGTSAVQLVALVSGQKIYPCALNVVGVSGTTPTFSLVFGTGTACATGQTVYLGAWTTAANTVYSFNGPMAPVPASQALCYLNTGTTPIQRVNLSYVQAP